MGGIAHRPEAEIDIGARLMMASWRDTKAGGLPAGTRNRGPLTTEEIVNALGGQRVGDGWLAHCPCHDDRHASLSISERKRKLLVHCFAGCEQEELVAELKRRGLWRTGGKIVPNAESTRRRREDDENRLWNIANGVWSAAKSASGTAVQIYLRGRGVTMPVPERLRFHPGLKHPSGGTWPAMIGRVTRANEPLGIHRTFLMPDGSGKAPVDPSKMMLGPCHGGAVRLGEAETSVMVGEGIETCLSAMQETGRPAWAALSASGLCSLELPREIRKVIILADGDNAGERAARRAAGRWLQEGRQVRIARSPKGCDFNDLLCS